MLQLSKVVSLFLFMIVISACSSSSSSTVYVSQDLNECRNITFECDETREYFQDALGCGCKVFSENDPGSKYVEKEVSCDSVYEPVCAEIIEGGIKKEETYANKCFAEQNTDTILYEGVCGGGGIGEGESLLCVCKEGETPYFDEAGVCGCK